MRIIVHRGLREIGGNIIEIASETTRLLVDAGVELEGGTNPVDFQELIDRNKFDAVLVSHYHADHIGLLEEAENLPPVYMGKLAYEIYKCAREYAKGNVSFTPAGWLENGKKLVIGDIAITPYLADHSAADAYSLLFACGGKTVLYTGDFRSNGRKSFDRYLQSLPSKVDALICEGTTLSRSEEQQMTEMELEKEMSGLMAGCKNQVFVMMAGTHIDRIVTVYKAMKPTGRLFLQDVYMAEIATVCRKKHIPNPVDFDDVYAYTGSPLDSKRHERARELLGNRFISRARAAQYRFVMYVRGNKSMLHFLKQIDKTHDLDGSVLIYSMWNGYKDRPEMKAFLQEVEAMGIKIVDCHTSGHADSQAIKNLICAVNPAMIVPVHTENEEWFLHEYDGIIQIETKKEIVLV